MEEVKKRKRVEWKPDEWLAVARELYRLRPVDQYLRSTTLAGLQPQDFFDAQRVLPDDRRRDNRAVVSMTTVKPGLLKAMAIIRAEIDEAEAARKEAEERAAREAAAKAEEEAIKALITATPPMNIYEAAFAPLIDLIATEVVSRMKEMLAPTMPQIANHVVKPKSKELPNLPRRLKFGVIGPLGIQAQEIKKAFPDMDFVIVESGQVASTPAQVSTCDKIIGMTDFMRHGIDGVLLNRFGDKYHRTTGSTSSVKRLIELLRNSMKYEEAKAPA